jgi:hypothetical protein
VLCACCASSAGGHLRIGGETVVVGHQDLPSDGHDVDAMGITESERIRWSCAARSTPNADSVTANCSRRCMVRSAQNVQFRLDLSARSHRGT